MIHSDRQRALPLLRLNGVLHASEIHLTIIAINPGSKDWVIEGVSVARKSGFEIRPQSHPGLGLRLRLSPPTLIDRDGGVIAFTGVVNGEVWENMILEADCNLRQAGSRLARVKARGFLQVRS